jgi:hypothetical protein
MKPANGLPPSARSRCAAGVQHDASGDGRPDGRARGAAHGDERDQPLRLIAGQHLDDEAPEHRHQQQVDDADAHVEHARQHGVRRIGRERRRRERECDRERAIDGRQQHGAADARHQPPVQRHDEDGEQRGEEPQVLRRLAADDGADGLAHGTHGEVAEHHAEEQQHAGDGDARLRGGLREPEPLLPGCGGSGLRFV